MNTDYIRHQEGTDSWIRFSNAIKRIASTEDGKLVLKTLKELYIDPGCVSKDTHLTYYHLGQSDLVRSILDVIDSSRLEVNDILAACGGEIEEDL